MDKPIPKKEKIQYKYREGQGGNAIPLQPSAQPTRWVFGHLSDRPVSCTSGKIDVIGIEGG